MSPIPLPKPSLPGESKPRFKGVKVPAPPPGTKISVKITNRGRKSKPKGEKQ